MIEIESKIVCLLNSCPKLIKLLSTDFFNTHFATEFIDKVASLLQVITIGIVVSVYFYEFHYHPDRTTMSGMSRFFQKDFIVVCDFHLCIKEVSLIAIDLGRCSMCPTPSLRQLVWCCLTLNKQVFNIVFPQPNHHNILLLLFVFGWA